MNPRALAAACIVVLLIAFAIDLVTPQLFVAAILLDIPIVMSAYTGNRRLTVSLIAAALVANAIAGYVNGVQSGNVWDALGIGDRILAALSIILVGMLGLAIHRNAERSGAAIALAEEARRERALREALAEIRGSLSEELVERAVVRQACWLVDAQRASLFVAAGAAGWTRRFDVARGSDEVSENTERPVAEVQSVLIRALETREISAFTRDDAMGRLVLDALSADAAIVAPLVDARTRFGALLLVVDRSTGPQDVRVLRLFTEAAAVALGQAFLFIELAKKNEELAQRNEVIRDIVYALSHDLRTPLAAVGLTLRQARQGAYGPMPPQYIEILNHSVAANDEIQRLAETLLLVAQYESGERRAVHQPLDLAQVARECVEQMEPLAETKHLHVEVDATPGALVSGDKSEVRRALVNLFANAVTWSREGGAIRVAVSRSNGSVVLAVADEGFGVPSDLRSVLFTRFAGQGQRGGGTGLGLYIVRRIAEEHGGTIKYEPNKPQGSIFKLELPALAVPVELTS